MHYKLKAITDYAVEIQTEIDRLNAEIVRLSIGEPIKQFLPYKSRGVWQNKKINNSYGFSGGINPNLYETYIKELLAAYEEDKTTSLLNIEISKHNEKCIAMATQVMSKLGLQTKEYVYKSNRNSKRVEQTADWLQYIRARVPVYDNEWSSLNTLVNDEKSAYEKYIAAEKKKVDDAARAKELEDKNSKKLECFATLKVKYKFDCALEYDDLNEKLLATNRYLRLAYYLALNRSDWNDGCSYAKAGLSKFTVNNETDKEIYEEISGYCDDWDGDGRVFRDCNWNYDKLFAMVEKDAPELYKDYLELEKYKEGV